MSLKYEEMSLLDAPRGSMLVHAVNCKGVWGSGIAKEIKARHPRAFLDYASWCRKENILGAATVCDDGSLYQIASLYTSSGYGSSVDSIDQILYNTALALDNLGTSIKVTKPKIYSNKFNSGLFNVPWERTESLLKAAIEKYSLDWTVCEYESK